MASEIKVAWDAMIEVRREMKPYSLFPEDKTKAAKEIWKQTLSNYKVILKAKKKIAIFQNPKGIQDVLLFHHWQFANSVGQDCPRDQTKDPWIGVNGSSNKNLAFIPGHFFWSALSSTS